jgi:predicted ABC-type ATPase
MSAVRVAQRVSEGGHDVPTADILRRFSRSLANLPLALDIADRAWVFDNSGRRRRLVLARRRQDVRRLAAPLPAWVEAAIPPRLRIKT